MDKNLNINAFKSFALAGAPTYGAESAIGNIVSTHFSIKKYSTFDLVMGTVVETA